MTPEIKSSPLRPDTVWKPHHSRHVFSGTLVFLLGIAVEEGIHLYRRAQAAQSTLPHAVTVLWPGGERQTNFMPGAAKLPMTIPFHFEVGVSEDGGLVWRAKEGKP